MLDCRATALTIRDGAVTGAEIDCDGMPRTIEAPGGVCLRRVDSSTTPSL